MYYSGIGSRKTPDNILKIIESIASSLAVQGYTLRSGGADGADKAFENGCDSVQGKKEIFLPWKNFNSNPSNLYDISDEAFKKASEIHPAWNYFVKAKKFGAMKLHARNVYQVLGKDLYTPVDFVVCWTADGAFDNNTLTSKTGGTGTAIRLAVNNGIEVFNLANEEHILQLSKKIKENIEIDKNMRKQLSMF